MSNPLIPGVNPSSPIQQTPVVTPRMGREGPVDVGKKIPDGTVVSGVVVAEEGDGAYTVRVAGMTLRAAANLPLFVGQRFRALWDAKGQIPVLRLQESDVALLGRLAGGERDVAMALVTRGLPLSRDVLRELRLLWTKLGGEPKHLGPLVEMWARNLPATAGNVELAAWYMALREKEAKELWRRVRDGLKRNEGKTGMLADRLDDDPAAKRFLQAHALFSKPAREGVDPTALSPAWWPFGRDDDGQLARVFAHVEERDATRIVRLFFEMEGAALGLVEGSVTTDGDQLAVTLRAEVEDVVALLRERVGDLQEELSALPFSGVHVGVSEAREDRPLPTRSLDVEA